MNFRTCLIKHNPPFSYGDCIKACIASVLDRDDVPHTFHGVDSEEKAKQAWKELREWMKPLGYALFMTAISGEISKEELFSTMKENNPDCVYFLMAKSAGNDHCVLCKDDKIIHNPSWLPEGITGPHSCGEWVIAVVSKI